MARDGSEQGTGNEAHRALGGSGEAEGAHDGQDIIKAARGASGDDLDRMERALDQAGGGSPEEQRNLPGGRNQGEHPAATGGGHDVAAARNGGGDGAAASRPDTEVGSGAEGPTSDAATQTTVTVGQGVPQRSGGQAAGRERGGA